MPPTPFTDMAITCIYLGNPYFNRALQFDHIFKTFTTARNIFQRLKSFVASKFEIIRAIFHLPHFFSFWFKWLVKEKYTFVAYFVSPFSPQLNQSVLILSLFILLNLNGHLFLVVFFSYLSSNNVFQFLFLLQIEFSYSKKWKF